MGNRKRAGMKQRKTRVDWDKVWKDFEHELLYRLSNIDKGFIEYFVESQLKRGGNGKRKPGS